MFIAVDSVLMHVMCLLWKKTCEKTCWRSGMDGQHTVHPGEGSDPLMGFVGLICLCLTQMGPRMAFTQARRHGKEIGFKIVSDMVDIGWLVASFISSQVTSVNPWPCGAVWVPRWWDILINGPAWTEACKFTQNNITFPQSDGHLTNAVCLVSPEHGKPTGFPGHVEYLGSSCSGWKLSSGWWHTSNTSNT